MKGHSLARESLALLLSALALLLALALYSFSPEDPSLNHVAAAGGVHNMVGVVGAWTADLLYQLFGYGSWFLLVLLAAAVVRILLGIRPCTGRWSSLFWLPFVIGLSALLAAHASLLSGLPPLPAGVGGALGGMLAEQLGAPLHAVGRDVLLVAFCLSTLVLASRCSLVMLVVHGWRLGGRLLGWLARGASRRLTRARERLDEQRDRLVGEEQRRQRRAGRPELATRSEKLEITPPAEVEPSRRAQEESQKELPLPPAEPPERGRPFHLPSLSLFSAVREKRQMSEEALQAMARLLEKKLLDYKVQGKVVAIQPGPVVVQFEFEPAPGTKLSRVVGLQDDLARSMAAVSVRVSGNISGRNTIGIEIPNNRRQTVLMHEVLASKAFADRKKVIPLALGVDIAGRPVVADLARMPHLLVAGTTGSGKSVSINAMICSMLMTHTPERLRMIMVDPKMLELSVYEDIPHLLVPVVTDPHKANKALAWAVYEMERRYQLMSKARVRNILGYNKQVAAGRLPPMTGEDGGEVAHVPLPFIVVIIDELADLMMVAGKEVEQSICRIAQKARAAGIHLILATQRPSVDVITGLIKANLPSRIAFQVSSRIDSRTILDQMGAEQLLGMGDSLFLDGGRDLIRVHGAFISDEEVVGLVEYLKQQAPPDYDPTVFAAADGGAEGGDGREEPRDEKFDEAVALVVEKGICSVSMIQRYLRIGYNRSSRIVEQMEREGIVTPPGNGGIRKVLARKEREDG
ncbi:MAG: DNA translocase FtsK [Zetaproteobacteria bacterium]|nr:MAG: DNA translocase FtsK [Zetaproteobacteria bacterium]